MITITDLAKYACRADTPVKELLQRIEATSPRLFQIVLDEDGRLTGTVTDGDVRRGILHGVMLDDPAHACMQTNPKTGQVGDAAGNCAKLASIGSSRTFLPILDEHRVVQEILIADNDAGIAHALVMAGGPGTRLGERTKNTPKPLLPVGGRPILDHILTALESAGVERIVISVHYLGEQIEAFIGERDNRAGVELIREPERLGTAGALGLLGDKAPHEPLLVVNGDVITRTDFAALRDFHNRHGYDGTIGVARYDIDVPFGVVEYGEDGIFEGIREKPRISHFIAAGVYLLSPEYFSLVPEGRPMDMPELLNFGREIGLKTGLFPIHEYWTDVGHPEDLERADGDHKEGIARAGK